MRRRDLRAAFIAAIASAAADSDRFGAVSCIRADFVGRCSEFPELAELLGSNQVLVGPMSEQELRRAIQLPARRAGLRGSGLADASVAEVSDQPARSRCSPRRWSSCGTPHQRVAPASDPRGHRRRPWRGDQAGGVRLRIASPDEQDATKAIMLRLAGQGEDRPRYAGAPLTEFDLEQDAAVDRAMACWWPTGW